MHVLGDVNAMADDDVAGVLHVAVGGDDNVVADFDVIAVVAFERRLDDEAVADAPGSVECGRRGEDAGWVVVSARGWIEDCSEETVALCEGRRAQGVACFVEAFDGYFALRAVFEEGGVDVG